MIRGGENDKWQTPSPPAMIIESPLRNQRNIESPETGTPITSSVEPQDADDSCTTECSTPPKPESTRKANIPGIPRIIRRSSIRRTRMKHTFWTCRNRSTHKHSSTYNAPTRTTPTTPSTTEPQIRQQKPERIIPTLRHPQRKIYRHLLDRFVPSAYSEDWGSPCDSSS